MAGEGCTPRFAMTYSVSSVVEQLRVVAPIVIYLFAFAFFTDGGIHGIGALCFGLIAVVLGLALFLEGSLPPCIIFLSIRPGLCAAS